MHTVDVKYGPHMVEDEEGNVVGTGEVALVVSGSFHADGPAPLLPEGYGFADVEGTIERSPDGGAVFKLVGVVVEPKPARKRKKGEPSDDKKPVI